MIVRDDGDDQLDTVLANQDFRDPQLALGSLQELARSHGLELAVLYKPDGRIDRIEVGSRRHNKDRPDVKLSLTLPAVTVDTLSDAAKRMGVNRNEAIRRAIRLLNLAIDAEDEGNHLSILTPGDEIIRDVVGFIPKDGSQLASSR